MMVGNKVFYIIIIFLMSLLISCNTNPLSGKGGHYMKNDDLKEVNFVSIGQGSTSWKINEGFLGPQFFLFKYRERWEIQKIHFPILPHTTNDKKLSLLANVDFIKQIVLIFTYGTVGSTGYSIELEKILIDSNTVFYLKGTIPDPNSTEGAVMMHPFHLIILDRFGMPSNFEFYINNKKTDFIVNIED